MRAAETERHAETLGRAHGDVGAPLARRGQHGQRQQVVATATTAPCARGVGQLAVVGHRAGAVRVLQQHAEAFRQAFGLVAHGDFDVQALGAGAHDPMVCGCTWREMKNTGLLDLALRRASVMASAAAVLSSNSEALEMSSPVRSATMVW